MPKAGKEMDLLIRTGSSILRAMKEMGIPNKMRRRILT